MRCSPTKRSATSSIAATTCDALSRMPGMGSPRYAEVSLVRGVRMLAIKDFENYLLFYLEREDSVDVIRVLHGARDIPEALQS